MENKIFRCYIFDEEQEKFLRSKKYKIDRMECFFTLVDKVVRVTTLVDISDHRQIELLKGQFMVTDVELSRLWKLDRKTCGKLMKTMIELGMFSATKVAEVTVYSMRSFSGWYVNGVFVKNDFYCKPVESGKTPYSNTPPINKVVTVKQKGEMS